MKHKAGCFCPYCGSDNIALSKEGKRDIVVVCDDCKEPIWSTEKGLYVEYWAVPIQREEIKDKEGE